MFPYPAIYKEADDISNRTQKYYLILLRVFLFLLLASSVLFSYFGDVSIARLLLALLSIAVVVISFLFSGYNFQGIWYNARAVAESIKTISWRYAVRAEPYDIDDQQAKKEFIATIRHILEMNHDFQKHISARHGAEGQIPENQTGIRGKTLQERKKLYLNDRVIEQRNWYGRKSKWNGSRAVMYSIALVVSAILLCTLLFLDVAGVKMPIQYPIEPILTLISILFTWVQTKKYRELEKSYALANHEIGFIESEIDSIDTEKQLSDYVINAENAFSREHTQWIARKDATS